MIHRYQDNDWAGVEAKDYKDQTGSWIQVTRRTFHTDAETAFQSRYFEIAKGGFSSHEMHQHEHLVIVAKGKGSVKLGDEWHEVAPMDVVRVAGMTAHQFRNDGDEPFGIFCIVDKERDRPILLDPDGNPRASNV